MATAGPNLPSAAVSLSNSGTNESANAWQNPGNIYGAGSASITAATFDSPDISEILVASGFGFNLNSTDTITGITVVINKRGYTSANSGMDYRVQLATGTTFATLVGTNKASGSVWPQTTLADTTYGGTSDTWSANLTATQANSANFSVFVSAYANVANADIDINSITVTLTYTPGAVTYSGSVTANAIRKREQSGSITSDAIRRRGASGSMTADAYKKLVGTGSLTADAIRKRGQSASAIADAIARRGQQGALTGAAISLRTIPWTFPSDALVAGAYTTITGSISTDAVTGRVGPCFWTSPADGSPISATPELRFLMPPSAGNLYFWLELDRVVTFDGASLRAYRTTDSVTNWDYWDGNAWTSIPVAGVANTYAWNEARFTVPDALTPGTWYRRVRAGTR